MEKGDCTRSLLTSDSESMDSSRQNSQRLLNSWVRRGSGIFSKKNIAIISGPLVCFTVVGFVKMDEKGGGKSIAMMGALCWIFIWWLTDAVPVAVTSLAPLYLFPLLKISKADAVAKSYMNDVISLVIGSFILALAVENYNMHKRLALKMLIAFSGETSMNPRLVLLGLAGATAFISMWLHNVAAAVLMMPVGTGILQRVMDASPSPSLPIRNEGSDSDIIVLKRLDANEDVTMFGKAVVLGVLYAAAIGGMSTLTGTGVNLILVGMWQSYFPSAPPITFMKWFLFAFPMCVALFLVLWGVLCVLYCSKSSTKTISALLDKSHLKEELRLLGPMPFADKMVLSIFGTLVILWMTQSLTTNVPGWGALFDGYPGDGTASVMMATLLFVIPSGKAPGEKLMDWNKCKKLPWNVVLLLGAGFAIADSVRQSGLAGFLSKYLNFLEDAPYLAIAPIVTVLTSILTEFTSNNATTTLFLPLLIQAAESMHVHPLLLMIPGAIGAQFAFLLPTGTPSNAVGFTTGYIDMKDMLKTGIILKFAGIGIVTVFVPTLGARVFGVNASP